MVLPYLGSLTIEGLLGIVHGNSSNRGFVILKNSKPIAKSRGFDLEDKFVNPDTCFRFIGRAFIVQLAFSLPILIFLSGNPLWLKALWVLGMAWAFRSTANLISALLDLRENEIWREYHACEHKTSDLICERLEPTVENLEKMPKIYLFCGTSLVTLQFCAPVVLVLILFLIYGELKWIGQPNLIVLVSSLPLFPFVLSFIIQFFFTVKEPRESILREELEVTKKAREVL